MKCPCCGEDFGTPSVIKDSKIEGTYVNYKEKKYYCSKCGFELEEREAFGFLLTC